MLRKFLHLFGRHHWSNWSHPTPTESRGGIVAALNGSEPYSVQNRHCYVCNLYQANVVDQLSEGYRIDTKTLGDIAKFSDVEEEHADF
jgi:hypothetical protein